MTAETLTAALDYAGRGLRVLPIMPGGKRPPMRAWQDAATTDPETIRLWWTGLYADHGVGIATGAGSGVFVLDVDVSDGKAGDETLRDLTDTYGELPETLSVITGSGGAHHYYRLPAGVEIRNDAGRKLGAGLDIRGEGGQVVAPPTIHPTTARAYEWEGGCGPDEVAIAEAPGWLLAMLTAEPEAPTITPAVMPVTGDDGPAARYNDATTWAELLTRDGWTLGHTDRDGCQHWTRPGKETREGTSATVGYQGRDVLRVFTSAISALPEGAYSRFGYTAAVHHGGDRSAFAAELKRSEMRVVDEWERSVPVTETARPAVMQPLGEWLEPIPLGMADALPEFPVETLPDWIAAQVYAVADELQMPPDLPAIMALTCLAAICAKRTRVKVRGGWNEPLNIYAAVAMPPSAGKSPAFSAMMAPLKAHERAEIERRTVEIAKLDQAHRMKEKQLKKAEESGDEHEAQRLLTELLGLEKAVAPRMIADDATPEALTSLLADHDGRIALLSTEGGVFDLMTGRYSDRANLDVYLKAWGGDDITVDRIGRGPSAVTSPALTIGLTVQPQVISALAERPELAGRGLTARFMYALPVDNVGRRNFIDQPEPDPEIGATYSAQMMAIAATVEHRGELNVLTLDAEASAMFHHWRQAMEDRRLPGADMRPIAEWSTKLESTTLRVAGLLHLADGGRLHDTVTADPMARAIEIGDYWLAHAFAVHDMWGADPILLKARAIMEWAAGRETFTVRDLYTAMRRVYPKADETVPPLSLLVERGWLRPVDNDWPPVLGRRGVPTPILEVHPEVARHARHARANSAESDPETSKSARHARHAPKGLETDFSLSAESCTETPPRAHGTHGAQLYPQAPPETETELPPTGTDPEPYRPF